MNAKKNKFKLIRFIFYFMGFPALCLATYYLLRPTFDQAFMLDFGKKFAMIPVIIWVICEVVRILLKKLANKGTMHADYAALILVITTVMLVAVPTVAMDYSLYNKYEGIRKEASTKEEPTVITYENPLTGKEETTEAVLYNGVWLPEYEKVMGWAIDNTSKGGSWYHGYIGECNAYIQKNALAGFHTARKGNSVAKTVYYDANLDGIVPDEGEMIVIGEVLGMVEDLEFKEQGKRNYRILATKLEKQLEILTTKQNELTADLAATQNIVNAALNSDADTLKNLIPSLQKEETIDFNAIITEYNSILEEQKAKLSEFKANNSSKIQQLSGQRVRLYDYTIKSLIQILAGANDILPDGLDIVALGLNLPVGDLVGFIGDILKLAGGININDGTAVDALLGAILKEQDSNGNKYIEIATGIPADNRYDLCAPAARKKADENYNYEGVRQMQYKLDIYPQLLSFARLRRVMYMWIGLLIISTLVVDHYSRKIKQIDLIQFNETVEKTIANKGYVLKDAENEKPVEVAEVKPVEKTVLDLSVKKPDDKVEDKTDTSPTEIKVDENTNKSNEEANSSFQDSIINGVKNHSKGGND